MPPSERLRLICIANNNDNTTISSSNSDNAGQTIGNAVETPDLAVLASGANKVEMGDFDVGVTNIAKPADKFADFFAKPRRFITFEWDVNSTRLFDVATLWNTPAIVAYRSQWKYYRGTPVMRVTATGSTSAAAAWMFGFCPLNSDSDIAVSEIPGTFKSGMVHHVMDLHGSPCATLAGRWAGAAKYSDHFAERLLGSFFLEPLVSVSSPVAGETILIRIEYWFEDVAFDVPIAIAQSSAGTISVNPPHCQGITAFEDDMGFDVLWKRPTYAQTGIYSDGSTLESPLMQISYNEVSSSAGYVASTMQRISGVLNVQLFCVKTPFHSGMLSVRYGDLNINTDADSSMYSVEWNIGQSSTLDLRIPLRYDKTLSMDDSNRLQITPISTLKFPENIVNSVSIVAYMSYESLRGSSLTDTPQTEVFIKKFPTLSNLSIDEVDADLPVAQCYDLKMKDPILLGVSALPETSGFTLSELLDKKHIFGYIESVAEPTFTGNSAITFAPGSYNGKNPFGLLADTSKLNVFAGFYAFHDDTAQVYVKIGKSHDSYPFYNATNDLAFHQQLPTDYHGSMTVCSVHDLGIEGNTSEPEVTSFRGNPLTTELVSTGDVWQLDLGSDVDRWNVSRTEKSAMWHLVFNPTAGQRIFTSTAPTCSFVRTPPKFYGMISSGPLFSE